MNEIEQPYSKPRTTHMIKIDLNDKPAKKLWIKKLDIFCHVAYTFTFMKAVTIDDWYFDSGCSRHMTREKSYLCDYQNMPDGYVFFGDGKKGRVLGKKTLLANGLPKLKSVLHVERLKANLLSISQLCDQKLNMKFTKNNCKVLNRS